MYHDWGLHKLYERDNHEMEEEAQHADALIRRLLFLETTPDISNIDALSIGADVPSMLRNDIDVEYSVTAALKEAISVCGAEQDYVNREMLEAMLKDTEEGHAYWLEQQLSLIGRIGVQNYLQSQL